MDKKKAARINFVAKCVINDPNIMPEDPNDEEAWDIFWELEDGYFGECFGRAVGEGLFERSRDEHMEFVEIWRQIEDALAQAYNA